MEGKTYAMKFSFSTMQHKFIQLMILWLLSFWEQCNCYPASRGYIFAVWAGVRKVTSTDNRSIFYRACAKFVTLFASKILSSGLSSNAASFAERKKLRQLWSATQSSRNGLNRSRTGKKTAFLIYSSRFLDGFERLQVCRGYFSHHSSHSEIVASARRVCNC